MVVAAGDIADCTTEGDQATATLVGGFDGTVLTLGDNAYPDASAQDFEERTRPSPGNHEYHTEEASAYFDYLGGPDTNGKAGSPFLGGG